MPIAPEPKDLHIDQILTNLSIQYKNEDHIWPEVLPLLKVAQKSDKYFKYDKADTFRVKDLKLGPTSRPNESGYGVATETYAVEDYGEAIWVSDDAIRLADAPLQVEFDTIQQLNTDLDIAQEVRVADLVFAAAM